MERMQAHKRPWSLNNEEEETTKLPETKRKNIIKLEEILEKNYCIYYKIIKEMWF